jgi:ribosomal protein S18 acetylase RimI-like enzyme
MTNIQAAFLYDQLNDIDNILNRKRMVFDNYKRLLQKLIEDGKIKLFDNEEYTDNADWIFSIRIVGNTKSIEETTSYFRDLNIEIRPFFYPINYHNHLSSIPNNDNVSDILNKEIIMIPSSPNITFENQMQVTNSIHKFVFYLNTNYKILEINNENQYLLSTFITKITSSAFRYFKNRTIDIIKNHLITILLMDNDVSVGYAHIDIEDDKYWFGICISDEYQSRGLGHNLMKYIFNHYKMQNIEEVYLTVDNNNTNAIRLYKKHNFIEEKNTDTYIKMCKNIIL